MKSELINRLDTIQEYLKIDKDSLDFEIKQTRTAIDNLKKYKNNLMRIVKLTQEIKDTPIDEKYKNQLVDVMTRYPELKSIREAEVLLQALGAFSNKEIGNNLNIAEKTVKFHKTNIFKRCGFKNTLELIKHNYVKKISDLPTGEIK